MKSQMEAISQMNTDDKEVNEADRKKYLANENKQNFHQNRDS